jgi:PTS system mannose-specific IIB component
MIERIRVDERLIHGQVASYWTRFLNISRIMVVDDLAAGNETQKIALKMACPAGVKLSVLTVEKACARLTDPNEHRYDNDQILVIFKTTDTLRKAFDGGFPMKEVNIGNIAGKVGTVQVKTSVAVTDKDAENLHYLADKGIRLYGQMVPSDPQYDFIESMAKVGK